MVDLHHPLKKRWALDQFRTITCKAGFPTSQTLTTGTSICWVYQMATPSMTIRLAISWIVGGNRQLKEMYALQKEMREQPKLFVNLVTSVAQALEMAKLEI